MQKILVVDDNQDILDVLQCVLEDFGYEVDTLSDGHYLFDEINKFTPDLILLDVMLGGMDGRELCKNVKAKVETHNIPVILISATHTISDDTANQIGAPNDFVAKPFDIDKLKASIERQLAA